MIQRGQPSNKWLTLVVLALGVSLIVIDGTIVNVSLPVIIRDLHLSFTDAQWVTTIYMLIFAGLLITTGRLADRFGRRALFIAGVVIFVASSLWAGTAGDAETLIAARAVQGIGGALILPCTLSTVNATFHGQDRAIAFGVWGSVIAGMAAVGPLLGGWLTTDHSWRWIFYINVPVGALLIAGILLFVPETKGSNFAPGADVVGFALSTVGLVALVFGLVEGGTYGWWTPIAELSVAGASWPMTAPISPTAVALLASAVLLAGFVFWEHRRGVTGRSALLELRLFHHRSFRWGNIAVLFINLGEFGLLFALPLYLQNALGLSALGSGFVLVALAGGAFATGAFTTVLARWLRPVTLAVIGLAMEAGFLAWLALIVHAGTPGWLVALPLLGYGAGLGLASAQLTGVTLSDVTPELSGQGSATQSTMRQVGSALGAAVLGTVLSGAISAYAAGSLAAVPGLPATQANGLEQALSSSAGGVITQIRRGVLEVPHGNDVAEALSEAFADATRVTLLGGALVLAIGFLATLRLLPRRPISSGEPSPSAHAGDTNP